MPEEINKTEDIKQELKTAPVENIKKSYIDDEENLTIVEKFARLEMETKIGLIITLTFFLSLIFRWDWLNTRWWVVLILGAVGIKMLYTQMNDLLDEKPHEARLAKYGFAGLIALLIIRDIYITSRLADYISIIM
jgi:hypothetical protein